MVLQVSSSSGCCDSAMLRTGKELSTGIQEQQQLFSGPCSAHQAELLVPLLQTLVLRYTFSDSSPRLGCLSFVSELQPF